MAEPSRRSSRLAIAGAALAAVVLGGGGFVLGRSTSEPPEQAAPPAPAPVTPTPEPALPPLPTVQPPLGRAELIAAAASAADAFAAGGKPPEAVTALAGREFELRLPFGCPGTPQAEGTALSWRYDEEDQALRLRAEPVRWAAAEWLPTQSEPPAIEAMEGFWIARPWTSADTCPAAPQGPTSGALMAETLGLAQLFEADSSRVARRDGKAFEAVEKVSPEALDASRGFRLRLRGRAAAAPGGGPVLCRAPAGPGTRPVCLVSVTLDEVAFENPVDATTIATWDVASPAARRVQR